MNIVESYSPFFDEVWCSQVDEQFVRELFPSTKVSPKVYVNMGQALLMKNEDEIRQPGFSQFSRKIVVATMELK